MRIRLTSRHTGVSSSVRNRSSSRISVPGFLLLRKSERADGFGEGDRPSTYAAKSCALGETDEHIRRVTHGAFGHEPSTLRTGLDQLGIRESGEYMSQRRSTNTKLLCQLALGWKFAARGPSPIFDNSLENSVRLER